MKCTHGPRRAAIRAFALMGALGLCAAPLTAQTPQPQEAQGQARQQDLGSQLRQQILESGLSPSQIRQQLASQGHDPSVLDEYLREETMIPPPPPSERVLTAVEALGIEFRPEEERTRRGVRDSADEELRRERSLLPDSSALEREHGLRVFGLETFARRTSEFQPMMLGPVPPGYVLGPGDEVVLILTGAVEQDYRLPVSREGFVVIPQVGQVWVNGLTMNELRDRLYTALGRAYSGVGRGSEATTHFEVTLGQLRSNQLFVTGEVLRPGSYVTSPVASVLNALYLAGGPRPNGSFRQVRVMRNGRAAAEIDLYAYLTRGDNVSDVVLQPGDVIFVPIHGPRVAVKGEVSRPAIYELREGDDLMDLLQYAGGLTAPAAVGRVRITRILPPPERIEPGLDRTVVDVDLTSVIRGDVPPPELHDGDELRIFRVRSELRDVVSIAGAVWKDCTLPGVDGREREEGRSDRRASEDRRDRDASPRGDRDRTEPVRGDRTGNNLPQRDSMPRETVSNEEERVRTACTFRFEPGMRAWDLVQAAEGLKPDAYRQRAQIVRLDPADSTLALIPFSLETTDDGMPVENPVLQEHDRLRVFARSDFRDDLTVRISGEVRDSSLEAKYREGLTVGDLLLEAGGLTPEADLVLEVSRRPDAAGRAAGRVTESFEVSADLSYIVSSESTRFFREENGGLRGGTNGRVEADLPAADTFLLRPHDHVFVRKLPNIEEERMVRLAGEVAYPGLYALRSKDERLSQILQRAGGLTSTAFSGGFQLYRNGRLVNVDLEDVMEEPGSREDVILLPGDSMVVPEYNPVVLVQGAVNSPAAVMYREGASLDYYIDSAGGYARHADRKSVYVRYANGHGAVPTKILFFTSQPKPAPGSTITVPLVPEGDRVRLMEIVGNTAQILATIGTALVILGRL